MKFFKTVLKFATLYNTSISVEDVKKLVESLDRNKDGSLSAADLIQIVLDIAGKKAGEDTTSKKG